MGDPCPGRCSEEGGRTGKRREGGREDRDGVISRLSILPQVNPQNQGRGF